jgi:hypothetical protein
VFTIWMNWFQRRASLNVLKREDCIKVYESINFRGYFWLKIHFYVISAEFEQNLKFIRHNDRILAFFQIFRIFKSKIRLKWFISFEKSNPWSLIYFLYNFIQIYSPVYSAIVCVTGHVRALRPVSLEPVFPEGVQCEKICP